MKEYGKFQKIEALLGKPVTKRELPSEFGPGPDPATAPTHQKSRGNGSGGKGGKRKPFRNKK